MMRDSMRRMIIDRLLSETKYVKFEEIQAAVQASVPTIKRDLRYMREQLGAPIVYSRTHGAYCYDQVKLSGKKSPFALTHPNPPVFRRSWYTPQEMYVLVKMMGMVKDLEKDQASALTAELRPLVARVKTLFTLGDKDPNDVLNHVKIIDETSVINDEPDSFASIGIALSENRRLQIQYEKRVGRHVTKTLREITPLRLVHYRNRWYVDAYCHMSDEFRTFAVEYIRRAGLLNKAGRHFSQKEISSQFDRAYGLFQGGEMKEAVLLFDADVAQYVRRQIWHPKQKVTTEGDNLRVVVPYANSTELLGEIMRWANHVIVESPAELREEVRNRLQETLQRYQDAENK